MKKENILFAEEKKKEKIFCRGEENEEGKGEKYLESENIFLVEEKKKREGKGGKYLEKEKTFIWRRRNTQKEK